ncbi:hypothetical protein BVG90_05790 [Serratia marcescens]|uniref:hypothetical protein n=1 Tax=Serratia marcescens TaxID=615 RepID=UPI000B5F9269|nr:hypothetical protein [Serratia marcescens]ASM16254.1 hypothetical protein BVG90_05790 [Serratia marcescens]
MEKLIELSKPVAEVVSKFGDPEAFGEREIKLLTGIQQMAYGTKFYSQEYVSALLAELEAKDKRIAELDYIRSSLSQVLVEFGDELGCNPDNESIMMAIDALKERLKLVREQRDNELRSNAILEKRLATPVRLPVVLMGYQSDDYRIGFMEGVEKSGDEVRAAGFTVEWDE